MNLDNCIHRMSWKKIIFSVLSAFLLTSMVHEFVMMTAFNRVYNTVNRTINNQKNYLQAVKAEMKNADKEIEQIANDTFLHVESNIENRKNEINEHSSDRKST